MYRRVLVLVDGSDTANRGLREAIKLARDQTAALRILHVVDQGTVIQYPEAASYYTDMLKELEEQGRQIVAKAEAAVRKQGVKVDTVLYKRLGRVADVIVQQARNWHADIIVLGTHGRRGLDRLVMGSDAELVVRHSPVPVLLVRPRTPRRQTQRGHRAGEPNEGGRRNEGHSAERS